MAELKNDPYEILKQEDISIDLLSDKTKEGLAVLDETLKELGSYPKNKEMKKAAEEIGKEVCEMVKEDVNRIKNENKDEEAEKEKKVNQKKKSKEVKEKTEKVFDALADCRQRLKEDRKRRIENGEIKPPKKKTLTTKLRNDLLHLALLIPEELRLDPEIIERTQKAILRFLNELKNIWGLNKVKPITDEIREKFRTLEERAIKPKNYRDN